MNLDFEPNASSISSSEDTSNKSSTFPVSARVDLSRVPKDLLRSLRVARRRGKVPSTGLSPETT